MQNKRMSDITSCPDTVTYCAEGFFNIFRISCKCIWILSVTPWISSFLLFIKGKSERSLNNSVLSPILENKKMKIHTLKYIFHSRMKNQRVESQENCLTFMGKAPNLWVSFLIPLKTDKITLTFLFCKFMIPMAKPRNKIKYLLFAYSENKHKYKYCQNVSLLCRVLGEMNCKMTSS